MRDLLPGFALVALGAACLLVTATAIEAGTNRGLVFFWPGYGLGIAYLTIGTGLLAVAGRRERPTVTVRDGAAIGAAALAAVHLARTLETALWGRPYRMVHSPNTPGDTVLAAVPGLEGLLVTFNVGGAFPVLVAVVLFVAATAERPRHYVTLAAVGAAPPVVGFVDGILDPRGWMPGVSFVLASMHLPIAVLYAVPAIAAVRDLDGRAEGEEA